MSRKEDHEVIDDIDRKTFHRYMSQAEADAVQNTGALRGGRPGRTYWTDAVYTSAREAQMALALDQPPEVRLTFTIEGEPEVLLEGTTVKPKGPLPGGGTEWMSEQRVEVEVIGIDNLE